MIISSSRIYGILIKTAQRARPAEAEIVSWPFQNTSFRHVTHTTHNAMRCDAVEPAEKILWNVEVCAENQKRLRATALH